MKTLFHTTSLAGFEKIMKQRKLKPGSYAGSAYVSLSEIPFIHGDISGTDIVIAFKPLSGVMKVEYDEDWYDKHPEHAAYIAGDGWREQFFLPEECYDEEGWEDEDCVEEAYRWGEIESFEVKFGEKEWISKREGASVPFSHDDVLYIIANTSRAEDFAREVLDELGLDIPVSRKRLAMGSIRNAGSAVTLYRAENAGRGVMTDSIRGAIYFYPKKKMAELWGNRGGEVVEKKVDLSKAVFQVAGEGNLVRGSEPVLIRVFGDGGRSGGKNWPPGQRWDVKDPAKLYRMLSRQGDIAEILVFSENVIKASRKRKAKLLDDMGVTDALVKKIEPYLRKMRQAIKKRDVEKLKDCCFIGESKRKKVEGTIDNLVKLTPEQKEALGTSGSLDRWPIGYEFVFASNREVDGHPVHGFYDLHGLGSTPFPQPKVVFKINLQLALAIIEDEDIARKYEKKFLRMISKNHIASLIRHEVTHAIRDAYTGHIQKDTKRRIEDLDYNLQYNEKGHQEFEYEIDAYINEFDEMRKRLGEKWEKMTPNDIRDYYNLKVLFPEVGTRAWAKWVKRLIREDLLTEGMAKAWGISRYRRSHKGRTAEKLMKGLLYVPRGVVRNRRKVEDAIEQIEQAMQDEEIRKPEWQILSTTLSNALAESSENIMLEIEEAARKKKGRTPYIEFNLYELPNQLWRVGPVVKKINRYRGFGKQTLQDWMDGWLRIYMIMKRLKKEMMVSGRPKRAASFKRVRLDKDEKEVVKNLSEIVIGGERYEFMQLKSSFGGNVFVIEHEGKEVGRATLSAGGDFLENIRIDSSYRRKGLATKMYDYVEETENVEIKPSPIKQSPEIRKFWEKRTRHRGAAARTLRLYHGTSDKNARSIKSSGLKANPRLGAQWYLLSDHIDDAIWHSETGSGKPVVMEFEIPVGNGRWDGEPYLWPGTGARPGGGAFKGEWYSIMQDIPTEFLKRIIKVSEKDLRRVKD